LDDNFIMFFIVGLCGSLGFDLFTILGKDIAEAAECQGIAVVVGDYQVVVAGVRFFIESGGNAVADRSCCFGSI
jgi:hypothetical protein